MRKDKQYCVGCKDDFYNSKNDLGVKECWSYEHAKVVTKYRIGWWTPQDKVENFAKVTTHNCHCESGSFAFYDELPKHLRVSAKQ